MKTVSHLAPPSLTISPPRLATILDCLSDVAAPLCPTCGKLVAIRWIPSEDGFAAWADYHEVLDNTDCHRCVLAAAPEMYRAALEAQFKHILTVRRSLHPLDTYVPDADGISRRNPVMLVYMTWQPPNRAGTDAPFLEEFSFVGSLPEGFDEDAMRQTLAPSPAFRTKPMSAPGAAAWAVVQLAIHARHPAVANAYLEWRWHPDIPEWSWEPMIRGFWRETPQTIERLFHDGRELFKIRANSGRPPGSGEFLKTAQELESEVFAIVRELHKNKKPGYRPSYKEIARRIDTKYRPYETNWKDLDRSFTRLCKSRGLDPRDLVDRAIAACATGE